MHACMHACMHTYIHTYIQILAMSTMQIYHKKTLYTPFVGFVNRYKNKALTERNYLTSVIYRIQENEWNAINHVINEYISTNNEQVGCWLINTIQYAAIITMLEHKVLLKERKCIVKDIHELRWKTFLNEKIANLRRKIANINLIIEVRMK